MKKKNEIFNYLADEIKARCMVNEILRFDKKRTDEILDDYALSDDIKNEYNISVLSPCVDVIYDNTVYHKQSPGDLVEYRKRLPGNPGDWTDDEDSYIIFLKYIGEKEVRYGYDSIYEIKIVKFDNLGSVLYHNPNVVVSCIKLINSNMGMIRCIIKSLDECKKLNNINEYLSLCIEKRIEKCEESRNGGGNVNDQ